MALKVPRAKCAKNFLSQTYFLALRLFWLIFLPFFVALRILGVALIAGEKGVALKVGEITPLILPLCTRLTIEN